MKRTVYLFAVLVATQLNAWSWQECVDTGASVDCLYWTSTDIAFGDNSIVKGGQGFSRQIETQPRVVPGYAAGIRGEAWCQPKCTPFALVGRYYWVQPHRSQRFTGDILLSDPIRFSSTRLSGTVRYHAGDIFLAYQWCLWDRLHFRGLIGAHILYKAFDTGLRSERTNSQESLIRRTHDRDAGGGGAIGLAVNGDIWCGLRGFAEARYATLFLSRLSTSWQNILTEAMLVDPPITKNVPRSFLTRTREFDLRAGAEYVLSWRDYCAGIHAGWEIRNYLESGPALYGPFAGASVSF